MGKKDRRKNKGKKQSSLSNQNSAAKSNFSEQQAKVQQVENQHLEQQVEINQFCTEKIEAKNQQITGHNELSQQKPNQVENKIVQQVEKQQQIPQTQMKQLAEKDSDVSNQHKAQSNVNQKQNLIQSQQTQIKDELKKIQIFEQQNNQAIQSQTLKNQTEIQSKENYETQTQQLTNNNQQNLINDNQTNQQQNLQRKEKVKQVQAINQTNQENQTIIQESENIKEEQQIVEVKVPYLSEQNNLPQIKGQAHKIQSFIDSLRQSRLQNNKSQLLTVQENNKMDQKDIITQKLPITVQQENIGLRQYHDIQVNLTRNQIQVKQEVKESQQQQGQKVLFKGIDDVNLQSQLQKRTQEYIICSTQSQKKEAKQQIVQNEINQSQKENKEQINKQINSDNKSQQCEYQDKINERANREDNIIVDPQQLVTPKKQTHTRFNQVISLQNQQYQQDQQEGQFVVQNNNSNSSNSQQNKNDYQQQSDKNIDNNPINLPSPIKIPSPQKVDQQEVIIKTIEQQQYKKYGQSKVNRIKMFFERNSKIVQEMEVEGEQQNQQYLKEGKDNQQLEGQDDKVRIEGSQDIEVIGQGEKQTDYNIRESIIDKLQQIYNQQQQQQKEQQQQQKQRQQQYQSQQKQQCYSHQQQQQHQQQDSSPVICRVTANQQKQSQSPSNQQSQIHSKRPFGIVLNPMHRQDDDLHDPTNSPVQIYTKLNHKQINIKQNQQTNHHHLSTFVQGIPQQLSDSIQALPNKEQKQTKIQQQQTNNQQKLTNNQQKLTNKEQKLTNILQRLPHVIFPQEEQNTNQINQTQANTYTHMDLVCSLTLDNTTINNYENTLIKQDQLSLFKSVQQATSQHVLTQKSISQLFQSKQIAQSVQLKQSLDLRMQLQQSYQQQSGQQYLYNTNNNNSNMPSYGLYQSTQSYQRPKYQYQQDDQDIDSQKDQKSLQYIPIPADIVTKQSLQIISSKKELQNNHDNDNDNKKQENIRISQQVQELDERILIQGGIILQKGDQVVMSSPEALRDKQQVVYSQVKRWDYTLDHNGDNMMQSSQMEQQQYNYNNRGQHHRLQFESIKASIDQGYFRVNASNDDNMILKSTQQHKYQQQNENQDDQRWIKSGRDTIIDVLTDQIDQLSHKLIHIDQPQNQSIQQQTSQFTHEQQSTQRQIQIQIQKHVHFKITNQQSSSSNNHHNHIAQQIQHIDNQHQHYRSILKQTQGKLQMLRPSQRYRQFMDDHSAHYKVQQSRITIGHHVDFSHQDSQISNGLNYHSYEEYISVNNNYNINEKLPKKQQQQSGGVLQEQILKPLKQTHFPQYHKQPQNCYIQPSNPTEQPKQMQKQNQKQVQKQQQQSLQKVKQEQLQKYHQQQSPYLKPTLQQSYDYLSQKETKIQPIIIPHNPPTTIQTITTQPISETHSAYNQPSAQIQPSTYIQPFAYNQPSTYTQPSLNSQQVYRPAQPRVMSLDEFKKKYQVKTYTLGQSTSSFLTVKSTSSKIITSNINTNHNQSNSILQNNQTIINKPSQQTLEITPYKQQIISKPQQQHQQVIHSFSQNIVSNKQTSLLNKEQKSLGIDSISHSVLQSRIGIYLDETIKQSQFQSSYRLTNTVQQQPTHIINDQKQNHKNSQFDLTLTESINNNKNQQNQQNKQPIIEELKLKQNEPLQNKAKMLSTTHLFVQLPTKDHDINIQQQSSTFYKKNQNQSQQQNVLLPLNIDIAQIDQPLVQNDILPPNSIKVQNKQTSSRLLDYEKPLLNKSAILSNKNITLNYQSDKLSPQKKPLTVNVSLPLTPLSNQNHNPPHQQRHLAFFTSYSIPPIKTITNTIQSPSIIPINYSPLKQQRSSSQIAIQLLSRSAQKTQTKKKINLSYNKPISIPKPQQNTQKYTFNKYNQPIKIQQQPLQTRNQQSNQIKKPLTQYTFNYKPSNQSNQTPKVDPYAPPKTPKTLTQRLSSSLEKQQHQSQYLFKPNTQSRYVIPQSNNSRSFYKLQTGPKVKNSDSKEKTSFQLKQQQNVWKYLPSAKTKNQNNIKIQLENSNQKQKEISKNQSLLVQPLESASRQLHKPKKQKICLTLRRDYLQNNQNANLSREKSINKNSILQNEKRNASTSQYKRLHGGSSKKKDSLQNITNQHKVMKKLKQVKLSRQPKNNLNSSPVFHGIEYEQKKFQKIQKFNLGEIDKSYEIKIYQKKQQRIKNLSLNGHEIERQPKQITKLFSFIDRPKQSPSLSNENQSQQMEREQTKIKLNKPENYVSKNQPKSPTLLTIGKKVQNPKLQKQKSFQQQTNKEPQFWQSFKGMVKNKLIGEPSLKNNDSKIQNKRENKNNEQDELSDVQNENIILRR